MTHHIVVSINGGPIDGDIDPRRSLGDFLRDDCGLTGTHLGCEHGVCGACTILVDDDPVRSCIFYAVQADGHSVRTIEGFEDDDIMARLRQAFSLHHALQCGFCTAGMLITGRDIIKRLGPVDEERVREELAGNLCRCTGYAGIVKAIQDVASQVGHSIQPYPRGTRDGIFSNVPMNAPLVKNPVKQSADSAGVASTAVPVSATATVKSRPGRFSVTRTISISYPIDLVWQEFSDPFAIAACLPGAELTERDGDRLLGRVQIKMGPIKVQFLGEATYALDYQTTSGSLVGGGRDTLSNSRASGELKFKLSADKQRSTALEINLTFALQGMLAQFSRPAIVNDFTSFIIEQFLERLSQRLQSPGASPESPEVSFSFGGLFRWKVAWLWKRLWRKITKFTPSPRRGRSRDDII